MTVISKVDVSSMYGESECERIKKYFWMILKTVMDPKFDIWLGNMLQTEISWSSHRKIEDGNKFDEIYKLIVSCRYQKILSSVSTSFIGLLNRRILKIKRK